VRPGDTLFGAPEMTKENRQARSLYAKQHLDRHAVISLMRKKQTKVLSTLSPKTATVAEKCDCRRKRRDNGDSRRIRRQSHFKFSATVAVFGDTIRL